MTEPPEPPPTIATMRTIGFVWVAVGVLAVLGGAIATVFAVVVFGILAVLLGSGLVGIQHVRARSAIRASRTLTNTPVPPADPPSANPGPSFPPPGPADGSASSRDGGDDDGDDPEALVGSPSEGREPSISEEEDGTGTRTDEDDDGRRG